MNQLIAYALEMNRGLIEETEIVKHNFDPSKCFNCGGTNLEQKKYYGRDCLVCSAINKSYVKWMHSHENYSNYSSYKKYAYNRTDYFQKCILQYQGKEHCNIPVDILEKIKMNINGEITRASLIKILKELKFAKHYKNVNKIYAELTGKFIDDIEY